MLKQSCFSLLRISIALAALVLAASAAFGATVQRNAVAAIGDLEYEADVPGVGAGWYCYPKPAPAGIFVLDDSTSVTGRRSQKVTIWNDPGKDPYTATAFLQLPIGADRPIHELDELNISAFIKTTPVMQNAQHVVWIALSDNDPSTSLPYETKVNFVSIGDAIPEWTKIRKTIQVPSGAKTIQVFFQITPKQPPVLPVAGSLWIDNVEILVPRNVDVPVVPTRHIRTFSFNRQEPDHLVFARKVDFALLNNISSEFAQQVKFYRPNATVVFFRGSTYSSYTIGADGKPHYTQTMRPEWILRDSTGAPIGETFGQVAQMHKTDVGSKAYQESWAREATEWLVKRGFEGLIMDCPTVWQHWLGKFGYGPNNPVYIRDTSGNLVVRYTGPSDWDPAMMSFMRDVTQAIKSSVPSAKILFNSGCGCDWSVYPYSEWIKFTDGVMNECAYFSADETQPGPWALGQYLGLNAWQLVLRNMTAAAGMSRPFIYLVRTRIEETDTVKLRFALASYLLGAYDFSYFAADSFHGVSWDEYQHVFYPPDFEAQIGSPVGPYTQSGTIYSRRFANALVVVNPSETDSGTYDTTETYTDLDGKTVAAGRKTLPPISALILLTKSDVQVTVTSDRTSALPGSQFNYYVTYRNAGSRAASNVNVELPIPADVTYVSSTSGGTYDSVNRKVVWTVSSVASGASGQFTCTVRING